LRERERQRENLRGEGKDESFSKQTVSIIVKGGNYINIVLFISLSLFSAEILHLRR